MRAFLSAGLTLGFYTESTLGPVLAMRVPLFGEDTGAAQRYLSALRRSWDNFRGS